MKSMCEHPRCEGKKAERITFWHSTKLYAPELKEEHGDYFRACGRCCEADYLDHPYTPKNVWAE